MKRGKRKKILLSKIYEATKNNEKKLKDYVNSRHTGDC